MKKKNTTIDDLARMVKSGFDGTDKKIDNTIKEMKLGFKQVDKHFDIIEGRLDKIEKLILADHKRRIEKLEIEIKELRELLAIK